MISLGLGNPDRARAEKRTITLDEFPQLRAMLGPPVAAGVAVNQATAKSISAFWCAVNVISGNVGVLDRSLEELVGDDLDPEPALTHPTHRVIHDAPNPWMTPQIFWQTLTSHALTWGNGYAEIEWDGATRPLGLWPITPDRVQPKIDTYVDARGRKTGRLWYLVDGKDAVKQEDMFVLPGLGFDGIQGYSVVSIARQSLGLSLATERFGAAFFGNGAMPGLVFQHPGEMSAEAQARFLANINDFLQGPDRAHRAMVTEEGMTVSKPIGIPPEDAQFLGTREFQVEEVGRWFDLPLIKLHHKEAERAGGSPEAMQIQFLHTLMPWTTRIEQEVMRKLMFPRDRARYRTVHDYKKLLVADTTARAAAEKIWVDIGALDPVHVARMESFPKPKPKPAPVAQPPAPAPAPEPAADPAASRDYEAIVADHCAWLARSVEEFRPIVLDRVSQYVRREAERVRSAAKKAPAELEAWSGEFYRREETVLAGVLAPLLRMSVFLGGSEVDHEVIAADEARVYLGCSKDEVLSLRAKDRAFEAEKMTQRWETTRARALTDRVMALAERKGEAHA
jgi:HK97 family phage portal protein